MGTDLNGHKKVMPGISIRNGPMQEDTAMPDANTPPTNGLAKRKARESAARPSYAEDQSSEDDDLPLVSLGQYVIKVM